MWKFALFLGLVALTSAQEQPRALRYNRYVPPSLYRRPQVVYNRPVVYSDPETRTRVDRLNYVEDESPKPYSFSYTAPEEGGVGSSSRTEVADGTGRVEGSYTLTNGEGHTRVVDYVSDVDGFRATVRTDEPGTGNQSPASVNFLSTAPNVYANVNHRSAYRHPIGYGHAAAVPVAPAAEELSSHIDQPVEQPVAEHPVVNALPRRPTTYYSRRPYYPTYRRDAYYPY